MSMYLRTLVLESIHPSENRSSCTGSRGGCSLSQSPSVVIMIQFYWPDVLIVTFRPALLLVDKPSDHPTSTRSKLDIGSLSASFPERSHYFSSNYFSVTFRTAQRADCIFYRPTCCDGNRTLQWLRSGVTSAAEHRPTLRCEDVTNHQGSVIMVWLLFRVTTGRKYFPVCSYALWQWYRPRYDDHHSDASIEMETYNGSTSTQPALHGTQDFWEMRSPLKRY